jgi:hypothetical protein
MTARLLARGVAVFAVATTAVGCSVFRPAPITDDLSTWSLVPLPPDPRFVQLADATAAIRTPGSARSLSCSRIDGR